MRPTVGTLVVFASYLALSAVWSWPVARFAEGVLVTRQFDVYPTVWLLAQVQSAPFSTEVASTAWPVGETLGRIDSYVVVPLAWLFGFVPATTLAALIAWVGPALGALAAERCAARAFDVPRPASWIAGTIYGFSGIAGTALMEGHVYHALNPWLPLLLWAAWRAQQDDGRWYHGFIAAMMWALALATTAYAGVLGALLLIVVALRGGLARLLPGLLLVGLPAGLLYVRMFTSNAWSDGQTLEAGQVLNMGSASLASLAGWSDLIDLRYHSIGAPVGWIGLFGVLLAPLFLSGRPGWRTLALLALLALIAAMGRSIRIEPGGSPFWSPMSWLVDVRGVEYFRFPVRFAWLYALCAAMVTARVLGGVQERLGPRVVYATLFIGAVDALVASGLPWRLQRQPASLPSAYAAAPADRAVLDLWARPIDRSSGELEMWSRALGCFYQSQHHRPILEVCMGTAVDSPRETVDRWLTTNLLATAPDTDGLRARMGALGVGSVVLHGDVYREADRALLVEALTGLFGEPTESTDGGEHLWLWTVPEAQVDARAAWELIRGT